MPPRPAFLLLAAALLGAGCTAPTATVATDGAVDQNAPFTARIEAGTVVLRNATPDTVTYRIVETQLLALSLFVPCTITGCPSLRPGEERRVPYRDITGWSPTAREAIVSWWRMQPGRDGTLVPVPGGEGLRLTL